MQDEMQLVSRLGGVDPLPRAVSERTESALRSAMAAAKADDSRWVERRPRRVRGPRVAARSAFAVGIAAAAVVAVLVATSITPSDGNAARTAGAAAATSSPATSPLVRLASYVSRSAAPAGDAALVVRTTDAGDHGVTVYDLYADDGRYFFSQTESGLAQQVDAQHNLAGALFAREVAAARLAATGDVQNAAQDMADAADPSHVFSRVETAADRASAAAKARVTGHPQGGSLFDNWVWENSQDALIAGSGDPQVRAGVLRILATLPDVTVTSGTSAGQPTLVLTAGNAEVGYDLTEQLTIDATTGTPVSFASGAPGQPASGTINYQVSRVTLSGVAAGRV